MSLAALRDAFYAAEDAARAATSREIMRAMNYQFQVQAILLDRGLRTKGHALISPDELVEMDAAFKSGTSPEQFVDMLAERDRVAKAPPIHYWCMACPEVFYDAKTSNAHHDATGHHQTWRPSGSYAARMARTTGGAA